MPLPAHQIRSLWVLQPTGQGTLMERTCEIFNTPDSGEFDTPLSSVPNLPIPSRRNSTYHSKASMPPQTRCTSPLRRSVSSTRLRTAPYQSSTSSSIITEVSTRSTPHHSGLATGSNMRLWQGRTQTGANRTSFLPQSPSLSVHGRPLTLCSRSTGY